MSLRGDKSLLLGEQNKLQSFESYANDINRALKDLEDSIHDVIQSDNIGSVTEYVHDFRDMPAANETDTRINGAIDSVRKEIQAIQAAIDAQEAAARAAADAAQKSKSINI